MNEWSYTVHRIQMNKNLLNTNFIKFYSNNLKKSINKLINQYQA